MTSSELKETGRITPDHIESLIASEKFERVGIKTTLCLLTLINGFEIVGTSGIVNPAKYDATIGNSIAKENAIEKIWELEGYRLQWLLHEEK